MKGSEILIRSLEDQGVTHIFGIPGSHTLSVYAQLRKSKMRHILGTHEPGLGFMADGYGRMTREPGVLLLTAGPGLLNVVNPVAQAYAESSPLVVISAACDTRSWGKGVYHELEHPEVQIEIFKEITKWHSRVKTPDEIPEKIQTAFHEAMSGRPRPVYLEIPENIFFMDGEYNPRLRLPIDRKKANAHEITLIVDMLLDAKNPVLYVGGGVRISNAAEEVIHLSKTLGIPVMTSAMAKGVIPENFEYSLGCGSGFLGTKSSQKIIEQTDLMLAVGTRFNEIGTGFFTLRVPKKLIHIDIDSKNFGRNYTPALSVQGDAKAILNQILIEVENRSISKKVSTGAHIKTLWLEELADLDSELKRAEANPKINPLMLLYFLDKHLTKDSMLFADAGNSSIWALGYPKLSAGAIITPAGYNSMGFALPAAIAAKIAFPEKESVAIVGDGSFLMTGMEFLTAVRYRVPIKVIVLHDNFYNTLRFFQDVSYGGDHFETQLTTFDFKTFAINCGGAGITITKTHEIENAVKRLFETKKPVLLNACVDDNVLPLVSRKIKMLLEAKRQIQKKDGK